MAEHQVIVEDNIIGDGPTDGNFFLPGPLPGPGGDGPGANGDLHDIHTNLLVNRLVNLNNNENNLDNIDEINNDIHDEANRNFSSNDNIINTYHNDYVIIDMEGIYYDDNNNNVHEQYPYQYQLENDQMVHDNSVEVNHFNGHNNDAINNIDNQDHPPILFQQMEIQNHNIDLICKRPFDNNALFNPNEHLNRHHLHLNQDFPLEQNFPLNPSFPWDQNMPFDPNFRLDQNIPIDQNLFWAQNYHLDQSCHIEQNHHNFEPNHNINDNLLSDQNPYTNFNENESQNISEHSLPNNIIDINFIYNINLNGLNGIIDFNDLRQNNNFHDNCNNGCDNNALHNRLGEELNLNLNINNIVNCNNSNIPNANNGRNFLINADDGGHINFNLTFNNNFESFHNNNNGNNDINNLNDYPNNGNNQYYIPNEPVLFNTHLNMQNNGHTESGDEEIIQDNEDITDENIQPSVIKRLRNIDAFKKLCIVLKWYPQYMHLFMQFFEELYHDFAEELRQNYQAFQDLINEYVYPPSDENCSPENCIASSSSRSGMVWNYEAPVQSRDYLIPVSAFIGAGDDGSPAITSNRSVIIMIRDICNSITNTIRELDGKNRTDSISSHSSNSFLHRADRLNSIDENFFEELEVEMNSEEEEDETGDYEQTHEEDDGEDEDVEYEESEVYEESLNYLTESLDLPLNTAANSNEDFNHMSLDGILSPNENNYNYKMHYGMNCERSCTDQSYESVGCLENRLLNNSHQEIDMQKIWSCSPNPLQAQLNGTCSYINPDKLNNQPMDELANDMNDYQNYGNLDCKALNMKRTRHFLPSAPLSVTEGAEHSLDNGYYINGFSPFLFDDSSDFRETAENNLNFFDSNSELTNLSGYMASLMGLHNTSDQISSGGPVQMQNILLRSPINTGVSLPIDIKNNLGATNSNSVRGISNFNNPNHPCSFSYPEIEEPINMSNATDRSYRNFMATPAENIIPKLPFLNCPTNGPNGIINTMRNTNTEFPINYTGLMQDNNMTSINATSSAFYPHQSSSAPASLASNCGRALDSQNSGSQHNFVMVSSRSDRELSSPHLLIPTRGGNMTPQSEPNRKLNSSDSASGKRTSRSNEFSNTLDMFMHSNLEVAASIQKILDDVSGTEENPLFDCNNDNDSSSPRRNPEHSSNLSFFSDIGVSNNSGDDGLQVPANSPNSLESLNASLTSITEPSLSSINHWLNLAAAAQYASLPVNFAHAGQVNTEDSTDNQITSCQQNTPSESNSQNNTNASTFNVQEYPTPSPSMEPATSVGYSQYLAAANNYYSFSQYEREQLEQYQIQQQLAQLHFEQQQLEQQQIDQYQNYINQEEDQESSRSSNKFQGNGSSDSVDDLPNLSVLTDLDQPTIGNLASMGVPESMAIQAYYAFQCDKTSAKNFLLYYFPQG